ncbi:GGDEF domain-containing protein [Ningiella sp. W23]|uniref:GGDEF domain-containing protein n=1 Tax=Ningiella sp. W23 TaxID=3023715 RepID=UPI0037581156
MLAVIPMLVARFRAEHWLMVALDGALIIAFFLISLTIIKGRYMDLSRYVLTFMICMGMIGTTAIGQSSNAYWLYPGITAIFFIVHAKLAFTLSFAICVIVFPFVIERFPRIEVFTLYATIVPIVVFVYVFSEQLRQLHQNLRSQATEDFLTQTGNRRAFDYVAHQCIALMQHENMSSVLVLFDMDHFKRLNDTYGHNTGDAVLKDVTAIVHQCLRSSDELYRLGGEEFAIILQDASEDDALGVAGKIKSCIAQSTHSDLPKYTVSFGISRLRSSESVADWMERADKALYMSKQNGRDQINVA